MYILTVNCGSSSLKLDVIDTQTQQSVTELKAERLPEERDITLNGKTLTYTGELLFPSILTFCLEAVKKDLADKTISGIGHRVVHGGDKYYQPVLIDEQVTKTIEDLIDLAPLHNPANLSGIKAAQQVFPNLPNIAVFDTAFH
ncbi:MAG TPA: acetate kinase, partial [Chitinophagales bacterium]|nr:acetate kinase [Chitinophagales bacterium]